MRPVLIAAVLLSLTACKPNNGGFDTAPPADAPATAGSAEAPNGWSGGYDLTGTEPFWSVQIRSDTLSLTRPDQPAVTVANPGVVEDGQAATWTTSAFTVRLTPGQCSDGMSDRQYPYTATMTTTDGDLKGCAGPPRDVTEVRP
jgi:uncharacterized membrane protein